MLARKIVIAIVGAGPFGLSLLERVTANLPEYITDSEVHVHLIDPCLSRGGRVWLNDQPAELWMNTVAGLPTLFTDESSTCEGPIRKGPTLQEWAVATGRHLSADVSLAPLLSESSPHRWASRYLMGEYLRWFLDHVVERGPRNLVLHRHERRAVDLTRAPDAAEPAQWVWLEGQASPLHCHRVILAQGAPPPRLSGEEAGLAGYLAARGGHYVQPGSAVLEKTAPIAPGDAVLLRGMGLTFFDYLPLFTTARGGRFHEQRDGSLSYQRSGAEPRIFTGSGRGVPFPASLWELTARLAKSAVPRYVSPEVIRRLANKSDANLAAAELTTLMSSELTYAYYAELLTADPNRCSLSWDRFSHLFLSFPPGSDEQRELVDSTVLKDEDRLDLSLMDDPLAGVSLADAAELQTWMRRYITRAANRMLSGSYTCDEAVAVAIGRLTHLFARIHRSYDAPRNDAFFESVQGWLKRKSDYWTGGAPWPRHRELVALSRAGVVTFLGAGLRLLQDEHAPLLTCANATVPGTVEVNHVVEARHASSSVSTSADPLRRSLYLRGELTSFPRPVSTTEAVRSRPERIRVTTTGQIIGADGVADSGRFAVGAETSYPIVAGGLPRAHTNSDVLLMTDRVARAVLGSLPSDRRTVTNP